MTEDSGDVNALDVLRRARETSKKLQEALDLAIDVLEEERNEVESAQRHRGEDRPDGTSTSA